MGAPLPTPPPGAGDATTGHTGGSHGTLVVASRLGHTVTITTLDDGMRRATCRGCGWYRCRHEGEHSAITAAVEHEPACVGTPAPAALATPPADVTAATVNRRTRTPQFALERATIDTHTTTTTQSDRHSAWSMSERLRAPKTPPCPPWGSAGSEGHPTATQRGENTVRDPQTVALRGGTPSQRPSTPRIPRPVVTERGRRRGSSGPTGRRPRPVVTERDTERGRRRRPRLPRSAWSRYVTAVGVGAGAVAVGAAVGWPVVVLAAVVWGLWTAATLGDRWIRAARRRPGLVADVLGRPATDPAASGVIDVPMRLSRGPTSSTSTARENERAIAELEEGPR